VPTFLHRIVADSREATSGIPKILERKGIYVQSKRLDVGDYVAGEYVVERKTVRDFLASLYGGRLFDQAQRISQAYSNYLLVVEGDIQEALTDLRNPRVLWGTLLTLGLNFNFKVFFTLDREQTADFLYVLVRSAHGKASAIRPLLVKKPRLGTVKDRQLSILESLPTIGPKLAERLLESYGSVRNVFAASPTELSVKGGIGRARAKRIQEVLDAEYHRAGPRQIELPRI
jgi:DNA excision repair protein ERCC-4